MPSWETRVTPEEMRSVVLEVLRSCPVNQQVDVGHMFRLSQKVRGFRDFGTLREAKRARRPFRRLASSSMCMPTTRMRHSLKLCRGFSVFELSIMDSIATSIWARRCPPV
jgi:hypothetical protein